MTPTQRLQNISARDVKTKFNNELSVAPEIWKLHSTIVPSDGPDEDHAWMTGLPIPSEFLGAYKFEGMYDFKFNVANKEYNLAFVIDRTSWEDQGEGAISKRIGQAAAFWATFKDYLFATLLEAGGSDTAYDGTAFFDTTRTIADSGTINNIASQAAATGTAPTSGEVLTAFAALYGTMMSFADDYGRAGFNGGGASNGMRTIISPQDARAHMEAFRSTMIAQTSNVWGQGLSDIDELPYLTAANRYVYVHMAGAPDSRGVVYQERTPLDIQVLNDAPHIASNHGVKVIVTQRFRFAYGEPRRMLRLQYT